LCRLDIQHVQAVPGAGISLYLPRSKSDRDNSARHQAPALLLLAQFKPTRLAQRLGLGAWSGVPWHRSLGQPEQRRAPRQQCDPTVASGSGARGIPAEQYTSHSLRRGFATWAHRSGWDLKSLMSYVGWRDMRESAMRYVETTPFLGMTLATQPLRDFSIFSSSC
jgi:integrase